MIYGGGILFYRTKSIVHSELRLFSCFFLSIQSVFIFILEYVGQLREKCNRKLAILHKLRVAVLTYSDCITLMK